MTRILVTSREGDERAVDLNVEDRPTLMEAIRNNGTFDVVALCGGMLSCSTCHIYVDPLFAAAIDPISEDELELLASSSHFRANSRLSCQIRLNPSHEGLRVTIAPED